MNVNLIIAERKYLTLFLRKKFKNIKIEDIEDIVQESLISACKNSKYMEGRSSLRTWISKIAFNSALDFLRSNKKYANTSDFDFTNEKSCFFIDINHNTDPCETLANNLVSNQLLNKKLELLKTVNPTAYSTFVNYILLDDYKAVVKAENITIGTVKSRIHRARKILQDNISKEELALFSN